MAEPAPAPKPARRRWVWFRRLLAACLGLFGGVVLFLIGAWIWLQSDAGNRWLLARIQPVVQGILAEGTFEVGTLDTNLVSRIAVTDVRFRDAQGHEVMGADRLEVRYGLWALLGGTVRVKSADASGLVLDVTTDEAGLTSFSHLFGPSDPDAPPGGPWEGLPVDIVVRSLHVEDSRVRWATATNAYGVDHLAIDGAASLVGKRIAVDGLAIAGTLTDPRQGDVTLGASLLSWDGDLVEIGGLRVDALGNGVVADGTIAGLTGDPVLDVSARVDPLDLGVVDSFLGGVGLGGRWVGPITAKGTPSEMVAYVGLDGIDGTIGHLEVDAKADLGADDLPWSATIRTSDFHAHQAYTPLATLVQALGEEVIVDGVIVASGSGKTWPDGIAVEADWKGGHQLVFGMDFDTIDAQVGLAGGVLTVPSLVTSGPMGDLVASGTIDLAKGPLDLRLKGSFVASELSRFGADGFGGTGWLDARFTGDPRAPRPVYVTEGHVVGNDLTYGDDIMVTRVEGDVGVRIDESSVRVTGDIAGDAGEAYGVTFGALHEPALLVDIGLKTGGLSVGGEGTVESVALPGVLAIDTAHGPWSYTMPKDAPAVFTTHLDLGAFAIVDVMSGDRGVADVTFAEDKVLFSVGLLDGDRAVIDTGGTFATVDSSLVLDRLVLSPAVGHRYEQTRKLRLRLSDGGITDADIHLAGGEGETLSVTGTVGTQGPLDAQIDIDGFDLGVVKAMYPDSAAGLSGAVFLHADVGGTADQATVKGDLAFDGTVFEDQKKPYHVDATFEGADDVVTLKVATQVGAEPFVDAVAALPIRLDLGDPGIDPNGQIELVADLRPGKIDRMTDFVDLPNGKVSARVEAHGPIRDPRLELAAVAEAPIEGWDAPVRMEIGGARSEGQVTLWGDVYEGYERRGTIDGTADDELRPWIAWALGEGEKPPGDSYSAYASSIGVQASLLGFPVESLLALFDQDLEIDGRIEGDLSIVGSPDTPVLSADLGWVDGHLNEVVVEEGQILFLPTDNGYTLDADLQTADGRLRISGDVPVYVDLRKDPRTWGTGDLALKLEAEKLPLEAVAAFLPDVGDAKGYLTMEGGVVGPATDPQPSLTLSIVDGSLSYLPLGVRYHRINLTATASRDFVDVQTLVLDAAPIRGGSGLSRGSVVGGRGGGDSAEKPDLSLKGRIGIENWSPTDVVAQVDLDGFYAVALPDQLIQLAGGVETSGTWPDLSIRGDVTVQSGFWRLDAASFLTEGTLELDERMVMHRGGQTYDRGEKVEIPPIWHSFDVAVGVSITRNLELNVVFPFLTSMGGVGAALTTANIDARLAGDLDLAIRGGAIDMRGEVEVIEGGVAVLQSKFDLEEGLVTFQGDPSNPFLDLTARMNITSGSGTYVEMRVRGLTSQPIVDFSSPDYQSDGQIMTILITGRAPDDLSAEQGFSATQAMMNLLLTSVLGGARLGSFSVDADGTVHVGLPLGRVYAEAIYRIDPDNDENHYALDYEIQLARRFLLDGTFGDRESNLDLVWEIRF